MCIVTNTYLNNQNQHMINWLKLSFELPVLALINGIKKKIVFFFVAKYLFFCNCC